MKSNISNIKIIMLQLTPVTMKISPAIGDIFFSLKKKENIKIHKHGFKDLNHKQI